MTTLLTGMVGAVIAFLVLIVLAGTPVVFFPATAAQRAPQASMASAIADNVRDIPGFGGKAICDTPTGNLLYYIPSAGLAVVKDGCEKKK